MNAPLAFAKFNLRGSPQHTVFCFFEAVGSGRSIQASEEFFFLVGAELYVAFLCCPLVVRQWHLLGNQDRWFDSHNPAYILKKRLNSLKCYFL